MSYKKIYSELFELVESYLEELHSSDERLTWQKEDGYLVKSLPTRFDSRIVVTMFPVEVIDSFLDIDIYCKFDNPRNVSGRFTHLNFNTFSGKYNYSALSESLDSEVLFKDFKKHLDIVLPLHYT